MVRRLVLSFASVVLVALFGAAFAHGGGHNLHQIQDAGWECIQTGPHNWYHCSQEPLADQVLGGDAAVTVKAYDSTTHEFVANETLIRADLYNDQPCPQEGSDSWISLGPVYACHR